MPAPNERYGFGRAIQDDLVGLLERRRVAVGRRELEGQLLAARDRDARRPRCPRAPSVRTSAPACRSGGAPRSPSARARGRPAARRARPDGGTGRTRVRRAVDRCLVTGVQQQHRRPDQLALRQPIPTGLDDSRQLAEQVLAGPAARDPDEVPQVRLERRARLGRPALHLGRRVQLEHQGHVRRPRPEQVAVGLGDPEQLGDHRHRHELHQVGDQVELAELPRRDATTPSTIVSIRGRRPSTVRGVNAFVTSRRSRVWSGGSMSIIWRSSRSQNGAWSAGGGVRPHSSWLATWR